MGSVSLFLDALNVSLIGLWNVVAEVTMRCTTVILIDTFPSRLYAPPKAARKVFGDFGRFGWFLTLITIRSSNT